MTEPFNPYAAPRAASADVHIAAGMDEPVPWTPTEVLGAAWSRFKTTWPVLVGAQIVSVILICIATYSAPVVIYVAHLDKSPLGTALSMIGWLVSTFVSSFFAVGLLRLFLDAARDRPVRFDVIFLGGDRWLPMVGLQMLLSLVICLGFVVLVVPGVILTIRLSLAHFYLVDAGMGPIAAMRASWESTKGQRKLILALCLLLFLVGLAGLGACCVGALVAFPLSYLAWVIACTRISGRDPAA